MKPSVHKKLFKKSFFTFDEFKNFNFKKYPISVTAIHNNSKENFNGKLESNKSYIIEDLYNYKKDFIELKNLFIKKFKIKSVRWDVHLYASMSNEGSTFNIHSDPADNVILQTDGLSYWKLPKNFNTFLETGDAIFIPRGVEHGCIPMTKRVSLSFAFWNF